MIDLFALFLLIHAASDPLMTQPQRAITLEATEVGDQVEIQLIGTSERDQKVAYTLEVTGASRTRHSGKTSLTANATHVLSTVRTRSKADWCAKVTVEEEGLAPYELTEGTCVSD
jgi:hypothetical protein